VVTLRLLLQQLVLICQLHHVLVADAACILTRISNLLYLCQTLQNLNPANPAGQLRPEGPRCNGQGEGGVRPAGPCSEV
jgi:hypothetical protein